MWMAHLNTPSASYFPKLRSCGKPRFGTRPDGAFSIEIAPDESSQIHRIEEKAASVGGLFHFRPKRPMSVVGTSLRSQRCKSLVAIGHTANKQEPRRHFQNPRTSIASRKLAPPSRSAIEPVSALGLQNLGIFQIVAGVFQKIVQPRLRIGKPETVEQN
jgi:hypothetical protein